MLKSKYKWQLLEENEVKSEEDLIQVLLKNRNVTNSHQFFESNGFFYDPFLFHDMVKTVERIKLAIMNKEKIMLYGDYDVDGVTGTAILYKTLMKLDANVSFYIPNRFTEGYGPNLERFKHFVEDGINLIITIDNGITGIEEATYLKDNQVDFIITDHHECREEIPCAYSIIHPNRVGESYPFKELSGCGVAFKLSHALLGTLPMELVDLAALGTYADIVSSLDENRSILKIGLKQLSTTKHIGLKLLGELAKIKVIDEFALGFIYGPRLNAPGRMGSASDAVRLLITENELEAYQLSKKVEELNNDRRNTIDSIYQEAIEIIEQHHYQQNQVIVIAKANWHEGVLGIVANKLVERYNKPVIILTENDDFYKGSCRTIADFPLFDNLSQCSELLEKFGGHKMAAGLQVSKDNLEPFRQKLNQLASSELGHTIMIDCIPNSQLINTTLTNKLDALRPFGPCNEKPIFLLKDYEIISISQMGSKNDHLRLTLKKDHLFLTVVAFNKGDYFYRLNENDCIDVIGTFEINEYNGKTTNQFFVQDLRCEHIQLFDYRSKHFTIQPLKEVDFLYFENNFGYSDAKKYEEGYTSRNFVLIDVPDHPIKLKSLFKNKNLENVYLLLRCEDIFSSEHLLTREKMGKLYQTIKKYKKINKNDNRLQSELMRLGFDKKLQKIAIQVFFELNFVIIENDEIIILDQPEKRNLSDSKTFNQVNETIQLKEKLLLSSTKELKEFLFNLSMED